MDRTTELLLKIDEKQHGNHECYHERALVAMMVLGLESGTRQNPFELIDE
jgi:hypothetical protein